MFCHTLALALGMTVAEVQERVSAEELKWWMAYNRISPIGPERQDYNAALIASVVMNVNKTKGKPISVNDVMLNWGETQETDLAGAINFLSNIPGVKKEEWQS